ncbi:MAG: NAD(+)/NADH kinase [Candidatus Limnocylindrales bacterium]
MTRFGFAVNPTSEAAVDMGERAVAWCREHGITTWLEEAAATARLTAQLLDSDALIVLGGDGTMLRAARAVAEVDVPILGVNSGKVGFLSKAEAGQLGAVLGLLADGAYELEERMILEATVRPAGGPATAAPFLALNEAAVVRGSQARVVRLAVDVDDSHLATYIADGLVVATPTGSTGYSFSAGGPILDPTSRNIVVTPVAAYLAGIRSVVVSPKHTITVRVESAHDVLISVDGWEEAPLAVGDSIVVRPRERPVRFIEPRGAPPFWDLLRRKVELLPS